MADTPQSFQNHARYVPLFHFVALPILMLNLGWCGYHLAMAPGVGTTVNALVAVALIIVALAGRIFALTVQDRVIRLEMRLRMREVFPADLQPRIVEFTRAQMVGLRFASDAELAELARKVLADNIQSRTEIKKMVKSWQADDLRA